MIIQRLQQNLKEFEKDLKMTPENLGLVKLKKEILNDEKFDRDLDLVEEEYENNYYDLVNDR